MFVVRPIQYNDFEALLKIADESGHGFTSLPVNEELLKNKILKAQSSFTSSNETNKQGSYLMVLENTTTGEVVGTCGIEAAVGMEDAFYHYRLGMEVYYSEQIKVRNEMQTLTLCHDYTGAAELCSLFLRRKFRHGNNGRLLSRSRFMLLAEHPNRFGDTIIAEMRGVSDEQGQSPFYDWLQEHFLGIDFVRADYLSGVGRKSFMGEMMPRHPIYVSFLPKTAQQVIGQVHDCTKPALSLLESEGFRCRGYVDIFDGGPTIECYSQDIKSVKESQRLTVRIEKSANRPSKNEKLKTYLISNTKIDSFRALACELTITDASEVLLSQEVASALLVNDGDKIRILAI